jgi:hypothetical protein
MKLLVPALVLCLAFAALADEFFDERYIQITGGACLFPTKSCVVLTEHGFGETPSFEFLDHRVLGASVKLLFPIREWIKLGAQLAYTVNVYDYTDPGKMTSEFDLRIKATLLSLQAPFSLYYNDWFDLMLIPQIFYYGGGQSPQNIRAGLESSNELIGRTQLEWEGVGIGGSLGADFYFEDLFVHLEGGWLQGGVDVDRMLWEEGTDEEEAIYLDPSSEIGDFILYGGVGYFF